MDFKDFLPLLPAIAVLIVGFAVTKRVTEASKRTDIFLGFTQRFHNLFAEVSDANASFNKQRDSVSAWKVDSLYRQLFGLMFDEFMAYRYGFLDREVFIEWMYSRMHDASEVSDNYLLKIGNIRYSDAWEKWSCHPAIVDHDFVKFLDRIHQRCKDKDDVRRTVLAYDSSKFRRTQDRIRSPYWPVEFFLGFLVATALFAILMALTSHTTAFSPVPNSSSLSFPVAAVARGCATFSILGT